MAFLILKVIVLFRYYVYMFVSLWKLLLFFALFLVLPMAFDSVSDVGTLFSEFHHSFQVYSMSP